MRESPFEAKPRKKYDPYESKLPIRSNPYESKPPRNDIYESQSFRRNDTYEAKAPKRNDLYNARMPIRDDPYKAKPPMRNDPYKYDKPVEDDDNRPIKGGSGNNQIDEYASSGPEGECQYCGRKFNADSLRKHIRVCQDRPDKKQRKVFDSKKARIVDAEQKKLQSQSRQYEAKQPAKKIPKWKLQSAQFRNAIKPSKPDDDNYQMDPEINERALYTQCPTCGRSFNDEAAKRHIPFCAKKTQMDSIKNKGRTSQQPSMLNRYSKRR